MSIWHTAAYAYGCCFEAEAACILPREGGEMGWKLKVEIDVPVALDRAVVLAVGGVELDTEPRGACGPQKGATSVQRVH